jgi:hypothetical protein
MPAAGVAVGPVDDAAFFVPRVFAAEANVVADLERFEAGSEVDVV